MRAFRHAAGLPWYRTLLNEAGVRPSEVTDVTSFTRRCPVLSKSNTFDRFPLHELSPAVPIPDLAGVLTSSGHGGRFSFGLITRQDADAGAGFIDYALDRAFAVESRRTLAINCLPMGVTFSSRVMTVATVSVREDMAVALVQAFGGYYDQVLLVMDPLFAKRLTDYAAAQGLDWSRYRIQVVIGEEVFGEHFRDYLAARLGVSPGAAGARLHHVVVRCRRARPASVLRDAGDDRPATRPAPRPGVRQRGARLELCRWDAAPAILSYEPRRTFIESVDADPLGYGRMTISMLDPELPVSLLRYQTGDIIRILDRQTVEASLRRHGVTAMPESARRAHRAAGAREGAATEPLARGGLQGRALRRRGDCQDGDRCRAADFHRR